MNKFLLLLALCCPLISISADRDGCADALDSTKRALRDASDKADEARDLHQYWKSCQGSSGSDRDPSRCESETTRMRSADDDLRSELNTLDRKYRAVKSECSGTDTGGSAGAAPSGDDHCDIYRSRLGQFNYPALLGLCKQYMPEEECGKCLGFRPTMSGIVVPPPATATHGKRKNQASYSQ